jgi:hypothetical protein
MLELNLGRFLGTVAYTVQQLREVGYSLPEAHQVVADELNSLGAKPDRGSDRFTARTIRDWCERVSEPWADTTSPAGRMVLTVFAGIAEFERELIHERTGAGRVSAKARGVRFGRPPKLTADQIALARRLIAEGTSVPEASKILKVHRATLYRALET